MKSVQTISIWETDTDTIGLGKRKCKNDEDHVHQKKRDIKWATFLRPNLICQESRIVTKQFAIPIFQYPQSYFHLAHVRV